MGELQKYLCHKTVHAAKIAAVHRFGAPVLVLETDSADGAVQFEVPVSAAWLDRHQPQEGGYFVRYADGYESYSPAEAFEGGYMLVPDASSEATGPTPAGPGDEDDGDDQPDDGGEA